MKEYVTASVGIQTGDNDKFLRSWWEVVYKSLCFDAMNVDSTYQGGKWYPYNKGGDYRKWYGNDEVVINWANDGESIKINSATSGHHYQQYAEELKFKPMVTWSRISSGSPAFRFKKSGYLSDMAGFSLYSNRVNLNAIIAFCNSVVAKHYLSLLAPTLNFMVGPVISMPFALNEDNIAQTNGYVKQNISISKSDWDAFEVSWDFKRHPLLCSERTVAAAFAKWEREATERFDTLKANEEELNRIFIDIYGLQDELTPEVEEKDVTVRKADLERDIRSFISYAVGCMLGRYSLDVEGLVYAGGEWDNSKYKTYIPDTDNCIPITNEEYFDDDVVFRFVEFVKTVYGTDTLEENLEFIAKALGNRGDTPLATIRNYFINDFYKDHVKIYQKRPIYWLFDSGKENGFKALIYMHRYNADTIGNMRIEYLHKLQGIYENQLSYAQHSIDTSENLREKAAAMKQKERLIKQIKEIKDYDVKIAHLANCRIDIDLDDGVAVNYEKVQTGKDGKKLEVLAKI